MKTLLSIDWDYFVPEHHELDMSHCESQFFINVMWMMRPEALKAMTLDVRKGFWDTIREKLRVVSNEIRVSESHMMAYWMVQDVDAVIMFDTHHDMWPISNGVHCADWLKLAKIQNPDLEIHWVKPTHTLHSLTDMELNKKTKHKVFEITTEDFKETCWGDYEITTVHACRSGAWTPPWFDKKFQSFIRSSGLELKIEDSEAQQGLDGYKLRWSKADFEQMKKQIKQFEETKRNWMEKEANVRAQRNAAIQ